MGARRSDDDLTVLYDEECEFCHAIATWLVHGGRGRVRAEPIGSPFGERALRDLTREQRYETVHVVDPRGRRWSGAESLPVLLDAVPAARWATPPLRAFPAATRLAYGWTTRNRRLLSRLVRTARHLAGAAQIRHEAGTPPRASAR